MKKVAVVANCQARPVADLIPLLAPGAEVTGVGVVHLVTGEDAPLVEAMCDQADVIFAQLVYDGFATDFVRTSALKSRYPGKVLVWPNLFFRGQCPDLFYATGAMGQRIAGPLGDYHLRSVLEEWQSGAMADQTAARLAAGELGASHAIGEASLEILRQRERGTDIRASDLIEDVWTEERLFFTFNHPRSRLIAAVAKRLLEAAGIAVTGQLPPGFGEPLGRFVPPMTPAMRRSIGLNFLGETEAARGIAYPDTGGFPMPYGLSQ